MKLILYLTLYHLINIINNVKLTLHLYLNSMNLTLENILFMKEKSFVEYL